MVMNNQIKTVKLKQGFPYDTLKIGVDVSSNALGLALVYGNECALYLFVPQLPPEDDSSNDINYVQFNKIYSQQSSSAKERTKMYTMRTLANKINDEITRFLESIYPNYPTYVNLVFEGNPYSFKQSKSTSFIDLPMFRAVIQDHLYHRWPLGQYISFDVLMPKAVKKEFTGDGNADKLKVIETAISKFKQFHWCGKVDDAADAFALATSNSISQPEQRLW